MSAVMGPDGIVEQDFIDRIGVLETEGIFATTVGVNASDIGTPEAEAYRKAYIAQYSSEPGVFGPFGYEAAQVVIAAIARAGIKDRAAIMKEVRETTDFSGMFGPWSFDQNGDTTLFLVSGNVVKDGKFEFVKKLIVP